MTIYHIVKIGHLPGNDCVPSEDRACATWARSDDKERTEVIAVDPFRGEVRRYSHAEAEKIAHAFFNPRIR